MRPSLESLDIELLAKLNREQQAEMQLAAREARLARAADPARAGRLTAGLKYWRQYLQTEAEHFLAVLHLARHPKPVVKHRHG